MASSSTTSSSSSNVDSKHKRSTASRLRDCSFKVGILVHQLRQAQDELSAVAKICEQEDAIASNEWWLVLNSTDWNLTCTTYDVTEYHNCKVSTARHELTGPQVRDWYVSKGMKIPMEWMTQQDLEEESRRQDSERRARDPVRATYEDAHDALIKKRKAEDSDP